MTLHGNAAPDGAAAQRWRFGVPPKSMTLLALAANAVSASLVLFMSVTLYDVHLALASLDRGSVGADIILAVLGLTALFPLRLALRSLGLARKAGKAAHDSDLIGARIATASGRNSAWTAISLTVAIAVVLLLAQFVIANDLAVGRTFFLLPLMQKTLTLVLRAFWTNIYIFTIAEVLVLVLGLAIAVARFVPGEAGRPIRMIATAYTDLFRGLPAIINVYLIGFGVSLTGLPYLKDCSAETFAIVALTLTSSAYVAEVYRAGIDSIHWSQVAAARSLGLTYFQTLRFVVVPQGVRRIIPPLLNNFISLQKDTALVNIIGALDAFNQSKIIASSHFNLSAVSTVAFLFVLITIPQARLVDKLVERRKRAGGA